ncbi:DUF1428 family protein [Aquibacillus albus]|uniref:Uncharacterized protein n=1 Tax=Aquibacillus albus TaxID=1168171 RepID=A0ABS2N2N9_9BACI|nr:DUF1428 family protein [Aquibacillus albus]MBM7572407.1 hypothetical protein [Aquibacillus albus]
MYTNIYFYLIQKENIPAFLELRQQVAEIMMGYGTLEDKTYTAVTEYKNDHQLFTMLNAEIEESVLLRQTVFRNESHYQEIQSKVKDDNELILLTKTIHPLINDRKVISASFTCDD